MNGNSEWRTLQSGVPFMIQLATKPLRPPPVKIPIELRPAATKYFFNSVASPTIGRRLGVKLSETQKIFLPH